MFTSPVSTFALCKLVSYTLAEIPDAQGSLVLISPPGHGLDEGDAQPQQAPQPSVHGPQLKSPTSPTGNGRGLAIRRTTQFRRRGKNGVSEFRACHVEPPHSHRADNSLFVEAHEVLAAVRGGHVRTQRGARQSRLVAKEHARSHRPPPPRRDSYSGGEHGHHCQREEKVPVHPVLAHVHLVGERGGGQQSGCPEGQQGTHRTQATTQVVPPVRRGHASCLFGGDGVGKHKGSHANVHEASAEGFRLCEPAGERGEVHGQNARARGEGHGAPPGGDKRFVGLCQRRRHLRLLAPALARGIGAPGKDGGGNYVEDHEQAHNTGGVCSVQEHSHAREEESRGVKGVREAVMDDCRGLSIQARQMCC
mmetsp:Transcript_27864/g.53011  ORF Transcript_27864/g.53011 Transcript_27864/m.53011 type:complete len:364 (+) Transcript_27864:165-1256(+)